MPDKAATTVSPDKELSREAYAKACRQTGIRPPESQEDFEDAYRVWRAFKKAAKR